MTPSILPGLRHEAVDNPRPYLGGFIATSIISIIPRVDSSHPDQLLHTHNWHVEILIDANGKEWRVRAAMRPGAVEGTGGKKKK